MKSGKRLSADLRQRNWEGCPRIIINDKGRVFVAGGCLFRRRFQLWCMDNGYVKISRNVFCNTNVSIVCRKKIVIGESVQIAQNVVIIDHDHDYVNSYNGFCSEEIEIGDFVWIGCNCTILRGTKIGHHSVIGANTVVKGIIPPYSVVVSELGHVVKTIGSCYENEVISDGKCFITKNKKSDKEMCRV